MSAMRWSCRLPRRIEPGIDAAFEARERLHALRVYEWQHLHHDHAGDVACGVDPEVGVRKPGPGKAARTAALGRPIAVDQEAEAPFLLHVEIEIDIVGRERDR